MATQLPEPAEIGELLENAYKEIAAGFPARAEPVLRDAIRVLPDQTTGVETCLLRLGEICAERGHYADAIRLNLRLLHDLKLRHGESNPKVVATMSQLAALYENSGRFEEAEFFKGRLAALEEKLVEAPLSEPDENIKKEDSQTSSTGSEDPPWLSKAFNEANRLYGKPEDEANPATLANIIIPEEEKTAYYTRPDIEEEKQRNPLNLPHLSEHTKQTDSHEHAQKSVSKLPRDNGSVSIPPIAKPANPTTDLVAGSPSTPATSATSLGPSSRQAKELKSGNFPPVDHAALRELEEKYHKPLRNSDEHQLPSVPAQSSSRKSEAHHPEFNKTTTVTAPDSGGKKTAGKPQYEPQEKEEERATPPVEGPNLIWQIGQLFSTLFQFRGAPKVASGVASGGARLNQENNLRHLREMPPESHGSKTRQSMELPPDSKLSEHIKTIVRWCFQNLKKLREKNNLIRAGLFVVASLLVGWWLADRFIPRAVLAADIYANCPVSYRTADGDVQFRLSDTAMCQIKTNKYAVQKPYLMYLNDWRDIAAIILGQPLHKQRWLLRTPEGLQSEEGPVLYFTGGPELQLADALEHLADESNTFYQTYSNYPNSTQGLSRLIYQNPYTRKEEMPVFRHVVLEDVKVPESKLLPSLIARIAQDEQKPKPGTISLCIVALRSSTGTRKFSLVRAFDRDGNPLSGSVPGTIDYIASENGGRISQDAPQDLLFSGNAVRPEQFWLIERGTDENTLFWLHWGGPILLGFITAILFGLYKVVQPENQTRDILLFLIKTSAILTVVFAWLEHAL
jgi:hypothetical protein